MTVDVVLELVPARIAAKIEPLSTSDCWSWTGTHSGDGYASIWWGGRMRSAHRVIFELAHDVVLATAEHAHHICRNRWCVNPSHVAVLNIVEHSHLHSPLKMHCKHGHPLSGDNVRAALSKSTGRIQRTCRRCDVLRPRRAKKNAAGTW